MKFNENKYLLFSVIIFFLSILLVFFSFLLIRSLILQKQEIPVDLKVGKIVAFNLDNSTFSFGTITTQGGASRTIKIENNYSFPIVAYFSSKGNISKFLIFEERIKFLPGEGKIITISTIVPVEEDYGSYYGKMVVVLKKEI